MLTGNRVVITGLGVLAPNGIGKDEYWRTLLAGESGIGPITLFDASDIPMTIAGEVKNFRLKDFLGTKARPHRMGRHTQFAIAACMMALEDADLNLSSLPPLSIVFGVSTSAMDVITKNHRALLRRGPAKISAHTVSACQPHAVAMTLSEYIGGCISASTVSSACRAGLDAISTAVEMIRCGEADMVVTGGTDAPIDRLTISSFCTAGLVSFLGDVDPQKVSRPFDLNRCGGIVAEGACCIILESLESALSRGATPYLEITGHGTMDDPFGTEHVSGIKESMRLALANAGKLSDEIDYICAHGPSDILLDRVETDMIKEIFGSAAYNVPVSSIKGATGNPLSAAGALQIATCAFAMRDDLVPPIANYENPDPNCDLNYVYGVAKSLHLKTALVNGHGMGGGNTSLVLERVIV
jgi:3-oxoacyl-[acyl-carrier-protein] synthase II